MEDYLTRWRAEIRAERLKALEPGVGEIKSAWRVDWVHFGRVLEAKKFA